MEIRSATKKRTCRVSVDNSVANLLSKIHSTMNRLNELWNEVAIDERARVSRIDHAYGHFYTLLDDIIKAEEDMVAGVYSDIEGARLAIADLRSELGLEAFNDSLYPPHSVALLKAMNRDLSELKETRNEKLAFQNELIKDYQHVCKKLSIHPDNLSFVHLLSNIELQSLREKKINLELKLQQIEAEVKSLQDEAIRIYNKIGQGNSHNLLSTDLTSDDIIFSPELLNSLKYLVEKAHVDYDIWLQTSDFEYNEQIILLKSLWDKCVIPEANRTFPDKFNPESQSQLDIDAVRNEVKYLQQRYEECKTIFDKLSHWLSLFNEKQELEEKYTTDALFSNRGGSLNTMLKRQNQLAKLLPKALAELQSVCQTYEKIHGGKIVYVENMPAYQYAEWRMKEYEQQKEITRRNKQQEKKEQFNREIKYGTTPIRDALTRNRPTSIKQPLRPQQGKISLSCSKLSSYSIISPIKTPIQGPKTSSPKGTYSAARVLDFCKQVEYSTPQRRPLAEDGTPRIKRTMTPGRRLWKY